MQKQDTITKAHLAETLYNEVGLNKREAREFTALFFEVLSGALTDGAAVRLSGFGNFALLDKTPRVGRNLMTGAAVAIPARRVVVFRPSKILKQKVASNSFELTARRGALNNDNA